MTPWMKRRIERSRERCNKARANCVLSNNRDVKGDSQVEFDKDRRLTTEAQGAQR